MTRLRCIIRSRKYDESLPESGIPSSKVEIAPSQAILPNDEVVLALPDIEPTPGKPMKYNEGRQLGNVEVTEKTKPRVTETKAVKPAFCTKAMQKVKKDAIKANLSTLRVKKPVSLNEPIAPKPKKCIEALGSNEIEKMVNGNHDNDEEKSSASSIRLKIREQRIANSKIR